MKSLALLLCCVFVPALSDFNTDKVPLAKKQLDVLRLLYKVHEPIRTAFTELKDASKRFQPTFDSSMYSDGGQAAESLCSAIRDNKVLKKHSWFSLFNGAHRKDALMLFEVLMKCKTWNCLVSNAAYFRERLNEGAFVYAVYVAVIHQSISEDVLLPPLYEIIPHMFANSAVITQAYEAQMKKTPGHFRMNVTGSLKNPEQKVAYYGEDIGMLIHHVTWHMEYPFWWEDHYGHGFDRKGELFLWVHHQLTARFDTERLSNHIDVVEEIYWNKPVVHGFVPHTMYKYGGEFPSRPDNVQFTDVDGIVTVRDMIVFENRVRDAIAHGYVIAKDGSKIDIRNERGVDVLGDVIEPSNYSPNPQYYKGFHNIAHLFVGRQGDPKGKYNHAPGVMEHFETLTRDPVFFRLHKYIDNIIKEHKDSLPPYTTEDAGFFGVAIKAVSVVGKLETYFEDFDFSLKMAVDDTTELDDVDISAVVSRLNHKPFNINVELSNSNKEDVLGTFRIFLCPRFDNNGVSYSLNDVRFLCLEIDKFWKTIKPGKNLISRKSTDASTTISDIPSFQTLLEKTEAALSSGEELDLTEFSRACGIPNRILLPRGKPEGMDFSLIVAVTDGHKDAAVEGVEGEKFNGPHAQCGFKGETFPDKRSLGFPLDRKIQHDYKFLNFPNFSRTYVTINHLK